MNTGYFDWKAAYGRYHQRFPGFKSQPVIGITGNFGEKGCELAEGYFESVLKAGATPVVIPPFEDKDALANVLDRVDGLLLSGGGDLNPLFTGEEPVPQLHAVNYKRDLAELLLIRLAYGVNYPYTAMPVRGIRGMSSLDIALAREFGYRIKLIAQVRERREPGQPDDKVRLEAGVFPALVPYTVLLARVGGVYNAVRVSGNACGSLFFHGRGAGDLPTAGAVLADLMAVARDENPHNTGYACDDLPRASIVPPAEWRSRYYVRVMVEDEPGVLRDLAGCMADQGVSMAQVIQRTDEGKGVPLVFMTHETTEEAMSTALQRTLDTGMLRQPAVYFRVLD